MRFVKRITQFLIMDTKEQEILAGLEGDIKLVKEPLKETITEIIKQGFSNFPIVIAHQVEIDIADKVIDKSLFNTAFHFSASTLEVMVAKGIIMEDKKSAMQAKMKEGKDAACILLLHPEVMKFVFYPLS